MGKNDCPHCGEKISTWKKWQLTDNRYGRKCPHCGRIIILPKAFVRFNMFFNIMGAVVVVLLTRGLGDNRTPMIILGGGVLLLFNIIFIQFVDIRKKEE